MRVGCPCNKHISIVKVVSLSVAQKNSLSPQYQKYLLLVTECLHQVLGTQYQVTSILVPSTWHQVFKIPSTRYKIQITGYQIQYSTIG